MIQEIRFKREVYNDSDELLTQIQRNETIQQKVSKQLIPCLIYLVGRRNKSQERMFERPSS